MYKSSFGAKADGPLADQEAYAPETTTEMSMAPCAERRECEFLLAMQELLKATEQREGLIH